MIIACSNCGMGKGLDKCLAEALGYKYQGAFQCPYFVPIDVGDNKENKNCGTVLFPKGHTGFIENKEKTNDKVEN